MQLPLLANPKKPLSLHTWVTVRIPRGEGVSGRLIYCSKFTESCGRQEGISPTPPGGVNPLTPYVQVCWLPLFSLR